MRRPVLIDLYCCEGGAAQGYHEAGWDVIGVDWKLQPRYPFAFLRADCLSPEVEALVRLADAAHASPPCQGMTAMNNDKSKHLNRIPETRDMLERCGKPYTIENVVGARAHLRNPVSIKGTCFDMHMVTSTGQRFDLARERLFEANWPLPEPCDFPTAHPIANVFGGHLRARSGPYRTGKGTGRTVDFPGEDRPALARALFEAPWMTMNGLSESVPPPFTAYVGELLLEHIGRRA